jgi:hypothetical protein
MSHLEALSKLAMPQAPVSTSSLDFLSNLLGLRIAPRQHDAAALPLVTWIRDHYMTLTDASAQIIPATIDSRLRNVEIPPPPSPPPASPPPPKDTSYQLHIIFMSSNNLS